VGAPWGKVEKGGPVGVKHVRERRRGPGRGTDLGAADAGGTPCGDKGRWGRPSEQCGF
jgi:hypothetical protein